MQARNLSLRYLIIIIKTLINAGVAHTHTQVLFATESGKTSAKQDPKQLDAHVVHVTGSRLAAAEDSLYGRQRIPLGEVRQAAKFAAAERQRSAGHLVGGLHPR